MTDDPDLAMLEHLVGDVERFSAECWGRMPLHRRGTLPTDVLSVAGIETLLLSAARRPTFRLVRDGVTLPPERSTRPTRLGGRTVEDVADLARIAEAMAEGATLVVQALQRTSLPLAHLCRRLERTTSHPVQANAYLTPAGAAGLAAHRDEHDVFVVQMEGTKRWRVEGLGDLVTAPGDVLYMPAGTEHAAEAQDGPSLHLTIGVLSVTYGAVIRRALDDLAPEVMARPLPLGFARDGRGVELADALASAVGEVTAALSNADPVPVAAREVERARSRRRPLLEGQLDAVLHLDELKLDDVVRRRSDQRLQVRDDEDGVTLELTDRVVTFPPIARDALVALTDAESVRVRDLPGIDDESKLVVARRLIREGAIVPASP